MSIEQKVTDLESKTSERFDEVSLRLLTMNENLIATQQAQLKLIELIKADQKTIQLLREVVESLASLQGVSK